MKIAVIGAGAMGCLYGAYLSRKNDVVMIDVYEPQVEAINNNGISITEADGQIVTYNNIKAYVSGAYVGAVNAVILFVKSTNTAEALENNKNLFSDKTIAVTLQNGAGNDRKILEYAKDKHSVIIGTSKHNAVNYGGGKIKHPASGVTTIGSNFHAVDIVNDFRNILEECGLEAAVSDDIQRIIWSKLLVNLSVNVLTAILGTPIGYVYQNEDAWQFAKRLIYEAVEVAEADGTYFDRREALNMVRDVCIKAGNGYSSMYQDRQKKIKTEIDAINGAIVQQARLYGVPTPYNSMVVDLIHAIEGAYDFYK